MTRIAILDDYQNVSLTSADWESIPDGDIDIVNTSLMEEETSRAEALAAFEVIVAMRERTPFPKSLLDKLPNLKLLITTGMRNLSIDTTAARAAGIDVCGTQMTPYAAFELTWALIMAIAKQIPREDTAMHEGGWQEGLGIGLNGKTLGILGLGKLGSRVAKIGQGFAMETIAWSQNLTEEKAAEHGVRRVEKEELFKQSDILTIHLVLSDRSRGLVGAPELALMKPSAFLVNTSRGPLVDETALVDALRNKRIAGAALDVYNVEPLPADHPYRSLDNTVLTCHTGYVVQEMYELAYGQAVENIRAWQDGEPVRLLNDADI